MKPIFRRRKMVRRSSGSENKSSPFSQTLPAVGESNPPMQLSSVLLPEPESPTIAAKSPFCRENEAFCSAFTCAAPVP